MNIEENMSDILSRKEPLHKDLVPYLEKGSVFPMLRHPLIFSVPYSEQMNALLNKKYLYLTDKKKELLKAGDYSGYVYVHERPYRLNAFYEVHDKLEPKEYWELFSGMWTDSENIWQNKDTFKYLLGLHQDSRRYFMSEEDLEVYDNLPEQITIYRGYTVGKNKNGFSYTLNKERAEWFAKRFNKNGKVWERVVNKKDIVAYTNARNEEEIIYLK